MENAETLLLLNEDERQLNPGKTLFANGIKYGEARLIVFNKAEYVVKEKENEDAKADMMPDDESCCTVRITLAMGKGANFKTKKQLKPLDPKACHVSDIISMLESNRDKLPMSMRSGPLLLVNLNGQLTPHKTLFTNGITPGDATLVVKTKAEYMVKKKRKEDVRAGMMEIISSCPGLSPEHVELVEDSLKYCAEEEFIGEESSANLFHHLFVPYLLLGVTIHLMMKIYSWRVFAF